jgi:sugar lactone lactonase YvrE
MFSLSTPWEVNTASQIGAYSYNTTTNKDVARNLFFRSDGTRFYIHYDSKYIYSWPMSTPWDVTTAGTSNNKLFPDAVGTTTSDYFITPNGLNLVGITDNVTTFDFTNRVASTAWSLTSFPSSPNTTTPQSISANSGAIRPDGTQIFTVSLAGAVNTFNLSTANNVTTATNANITFTAGPFASQPSSIRFSTDGTKMYIMDFFPGTVYQYNLV